jgi:hypothetical protein
MRLLFEAHLLVEPFWAARMQDTGGVDHKELFAVISLNFEKLPNSPAGGVEVAMETAVFT